MCVKSRKRGFMLAVLGLIIPSIPIEDILLKGIRTNHDSMLLISICGWTVVLLLGIHNSYITVSKVPRV